MRTRRVARRGYEITEVLCEAQSFNTRKGVFLLAKGRYRAPQNSEILWVISSAGWRNAFLSKILDISVFFDIFTVGIVIKKGNEMTRNEVLCKVLEIVNEHKAHNFPEATENSRFAEDLGMDSFDIVETCWDIQRVLLDIDFDYDDWDAIKFNTTSVKDVVNLVCKNLNIPVNNAEKKSNLKLNMLYPIIAGLLFTGCGFVECKDNVVVVPGKNKIIVKDVKDGQERIFFTNKSDNRFQGLNVGDTINVRRRRGYGDYDYYRVFDDDNKYIHIDVNDLHVVREKFRFDSIKNAMLRDSVAQNKR